MDSPAVYIPIDRRHALARGEQLPQWMTGSALFADISGFTPLTEALALELGVRRGAEELTVHLNSVYNKLIDVLHRYGGSAIGFSGDAITCWLDADDGRRATAAALAMQQAMQQFDAVRTHSGNVVSLGMKAAVVTGGVRRFYVGDPDYCLIDTMAGSTLERLAAAEHQAQRGEVIVDEQTAERLGALLVIDDWRVEEQTQRRFARVTGLTEPVDETPWPTLDVTLSAEVQSAWLLPPVYKRLARGLGDFLAELRPAVALFMRFGGIDYDSDADAPEKLDRFVRAVQHILLRYDGSLIQLTIGDKGSYLYAAFGAPVAHEDDAVRAASTALELQNLAEGLDYLEEPQIGITVGRMRTGAYGSVTRRTYGVLGDAVNLAARLMAAAKPGHILVSEDARAATGETFDWENLPNIRVKGKSEPVTLSRLLSLRRRTVGLQAADYRLPMVGRQAELQAIAERLEQMQAGRGQIVGITAEAGMGKSRLAAEVIKLAAANDVVVLGGECQSYGTATSYLVWQTIWRGFFDLNPSLSPEAQIARLQQQLEQVDPLLTGRLPLLGKVLNLTIEDNALTASLDAKIRKQSLESLLVTLLRARTTTTPILIVLEDVHWIDPLSADLLQEVARAIGNLPLMLLLVYRPPDRQRRQRVALDRFAYFHEVALGDFTEDEAARLIRLKLEQFFGSGVHVPERFRERITRQAAGNPFYIEELLNYLHDLEIDPQNSDALEQVELPDSVYNLVLSRIDRLSEQQQITLKVASVIGRVFQAAMLWGIYPKLGEAQQVRKILDRFSEIGLTPLDVPEPELVYLFKHIVTQQVAYESLLYSTRAWLHEEIGAYIERVEADRIDQFVDLLAYHYGRSQNVEKQRVYFLRAADAAAAGYANSAAIGYYRQALPLLLQSEQIDTHLKLGRVLEHTVAWDEAWEQYAQAHQLATEANDAGREAWCEASMGELLRKQGKYEDAAGRLERARSRFEQVGDLPGVGQALHTAGTVAAQQGDYTRASDLYQQSLAIRQQLGDRRSTASLYGNMGIVARYQGDIDSARRYYQDSLHLCEQINDRWLLAASLNNLGLLTLSQGNRSEARALLERALLIYREIGAQWSVANTLHNLANVARDEREHDTAQRLYRESVEVWQELDDKWALAYWLEDTARWATQRNLFALAVRLASRADALRTAASIPLAPANKLELNEALRPARDVLTAQQLLTEEAAGAALTLDDAIAQALL